MANLNGAKFAGDLQALVNKFNSDVVELVHRAQEEEGLDWQTDKPVSWADDQYDHEVDNILQIGGWIYDRLHGRNRLHRKSLTKKLRKALGFTSP